MTPPRHASVVVVGAGQAGLSAAYHLRRRGFAGLGPGDDGVTGVPADAPGTFVVLDAEDAPGGAWRHRWDSLTMATVNHIHELPGHPVPPADPAARANRVLPEYFADYERRFLLPVHRPVRVQRVERPGEGGPGHFTVRTDAGTWTADWLVNATGTWTAPHWPSVPGMGTFGGRQLHVHDYVSRDEFAGQRVVVVGMGVSATQLLAEISTVADTLWVTRRPPHWIDGPAPGLLAEAVQGVDERTRAGLPPASVVRATGMFRSAWVREAEARGVLVRHPMFTAVEPDGVRMPDGWLEPADAILWATGFRPAIRHLAPLRLRTRAGGIRVAGSRAVDEPRLFLIGYGPSQSTVGANRAGRDAVRAILATPPG